MGVKAWWRAEQNDQAPAESAGARKSARNWGETQRQRSVPHNDRSQFVQFDLCVRQSFAQLTCACFANTRVEQT